MIRLRRSLLLAALHALSLLAGAGEAAAQLCFFSITNPIDFNTIDVTANTTFSTTGTFSALCIGQANRTVRICPNINTGTGNPASGVPRGLANGVNILNYNLYQDAAYTTVWGSHLWAFAPTPPTINLPLGGSGFAATSRTIYAQVNAGQQTLPAGLYTSSFAGAQTAIAYAYTSAGSCAAIGSTNAQQVGFTVRATVSTTCRVAGNTLDFGTVALLSSDVDSNGSSAVTCTNGTPYRVLLDNGLTGTGPTNRKMTLGGSEVVYGLYRDAARSQPWGDISGTNSLSATGTGLAQSHTIYGRVPPQMTPATGTYSDTIVISVEY
jgi:spore coat protein U-like protein